MPGSIPGTRGIFLGVTFKWKGREPMLRVLFFVAVIVWAAVVAE
jgi:hypothetical protein